MMNVEGLHPEYIVDENNRKKSVILSASAFEELMEDIADLAAIAERKNESVVTHGMLLRELKLDEL